MAAYRNNSEARLISAVREENVETVRQLLAAGGNPNTMSNTGNPILSEAVSMNQWNMVKLLLEYQADPNQVGQVGSSPAPIHWAFLDGNDNGDIVSLLIGYGAKYDEGLAEWGIQNDSLVASGVVVYYLLRDALLNNNLGEMKRLMKKFAGLININYQDSKGLTLLSRAVNIPSPEIIKFLVSSGANVNIPTPMGVPPLFRLVSHVTDESKNAFSYKEVIDLLLAHGANIQAKDQNKNTIFHYAARSQSGNIFPYLETKYLEIVGRLPNLFLTNKQGESPLLLTIIGSDVNEGGFEYLWKFVSFGGYMTSINWAYHLIMNYDTASSTGGFDLYDIVIGPLCELTKGKASEFLKDMAKKRIPVGTKEIEDYAKQMYPDPPGYEKTNYFYDCFVEEAQRILQNGAGGGGRGKKKTRRARKTRRVR